MDEFSSILGLSDLGEIITAPTSAQEEHEDVFKNAVGEFTRINEFRSILTLQIWDKLSQPQQVHKKSMRMFLKMLLVSSQE